ncbi:MAG: hypothetical protein LLG04_10795 [Parachlamydia sp.]|nr:hypothetical protein [Parachlamydia sp.]
MSQREAAIDRIDSMSIKKPQWVNLGSDAVASTEPSQKKRSQKVDSLESLKPEANQEEKNPVSQKKQQAQKNSQENSPGFWSKVWSGLCGLFGRSTAATTAANNGSSNQPGGDGMQTIGGSPSLEAPFMFDLKKFTQMLKEARDALNQVKETNNDADEEFTKSGSEKSQERLLQHLKAQREIYQEGAELVKTKYVRHQEVQREVRKKLSDAKTEKGEFAEKERNWGWWKRAATFGLITATVGLIAITAIGTAGLSLGAGAAALGIAFKVAVPFMTGSQAMTSIMQSSMNQQLRDKTSAVTTLTHLQNRISQYQVPDDIAQMNQNWDHSLKIVTEHLKRQEENRNNTIKSIVSDMSSR